VEEFIITFRESLEAALIIGIIFSYLKKTGSKKLYSFVYYGIALGVLGSVLGAFIFYRFVGGFNGPSEQIFEGVTMVLGASLIVYLIVWMANKKDTSDLIRNQVDKALEHSSITLIFLVFISIFREGVETTLFLNVVISSQVGISQTFAFLGLLGGSFVGYGVYIGLKGMNLKYLFSISSTLLILFATGLFAQGVHEFQEVGFIPIFINHVWDINDVVNENSMVGGFMKSLFGYNANPSLLEVFTYCASLVFMLLIYNKRIEFYKKSNLN